LGRRAVIFERAYAVAPMTQPAHATLLTGRLPTRSGVRWNGEQRLRDDVPTLAENLAEAGYAAGAFVSAAVLDHAFGMNRGFQIYDDEVGSEGGVWHAERDGRETVRRALAWLDGVPDDRPVFLWVHIYEPHDPYQPPAPFDSRFAGDPYLGEIAAADAALAPLFDHRRWTAGADAVVAVVGDHGESLGEHGEVTHGILIFDGVLRVPLLLAAPGIEPRRVAAEVTQADLVPTLLELAGLPGLPGSDGVSLVAALRGAAESRARTLYAESLYPQYLYGWAPLRSTRRGGWKWMAGARSELFDTGHDPGETHDLAADHPAEAATLERALGEFRLAEVAPTQAVVDEQLSAQLRSLGYLPGSASASGAGDGLAGGLGEPRDLIAVHERMRAIDAHLRADEIEAAQAELRRVLVENPDNLMAQQAVERQLRSALERDGAAGKPELRVVLAQALVSLGRREEARLELAKAADTEVTTAAGLNARAFARLELGRAEEAAGDWQRLASENPQDPDPLLNLGSLAISQRRFADGERFARAAVNLAPDSAAARNTLAIALEELGRHDEALANYRAALAADPAYWQADLNLGLLLARRGQKEAAIAALERVLGRVPRQPLAHLGLAQLRLQQGRRDDARRHLEAFLAEAPTHPKAAEARRLLALLDAGQDPKT
jgi:arylsulfatase A-like enzyme/tetratricopeptide (TPR) repeat protein